MELDPKVHVSAFWWAGLESRGFGTITCHQWAELNTRVSGGNSGAGVEGLDLGPLDWDVS